MKFIYPQRARVHELMRDRPWYSLDTRATPFYDYVISPVIGQPRQHAFHHAEVDVAPGV
jgi:hypothetical protein